MDNWVSPERVTWVDTAKGFGIILVVVGHVLRGLVSSEILAPTAMFRFVDAWIYAFHMPLFFLLSGLFLARSSQKSWGAFITDKVRTILYPLIIWSVINIIVKAPLGSMVNRPRKFSDLFLILIDPFDQFWFLYVLFISTIVIGSILKLGAKQWLVLLFAFLIYPGILPINVLGIVAVDFTRIFAIYLVLGVIVGNSRLFPELSNTGTGWLAGVSLLGFSAVAVFTYWTSLNSQYWFQFVLAVIGSTAVVALSLITSKLKVDSAFQLLGRYSLEIFVAHVIGSGAVRIVLQRLAHIYDPKLHILLGTLAGLFGPIVFAVICNRIGFVWAFTLPKSSPSSSPSRAAAPSPLSKRS